MTTTDDPIATKLGEVHAEIARLRAENERLTRQASAPVLTPERAAILDDAAEATARMVAAIQGQARDGESPDQTVERIIWERDGLRKNFGRAIADLRETEREREQLRADVETLAHKLEAAEGDLRRAEHDLRATTQTAIPAIRAGINALGSSEVDVRSRNAARDSLHALEAAVEGAEPPAAVLSAAERKAVAALRRWRELPDERIGDPFAAEWLDVLEAADAMIEAGRPLASEEKEG